MGLEAHRHQWSRREDNEQWDHISDMCLDGDGFEPKPFGFGRSGSVEVGRGVVAVVPALGGSGSEEDRQPIFARKFQKQPATLCLVGAQGDSVSGLVERWEGEVPQGGGVTSLGSEAEEEAGKEKAAAPTSRGTPAEACCRLGRVELVDRLRGKAAADEETTTRMTREIANPAPLEPIRRRCFKLKEAVDGIRRDGSSKDDFNGNRQRES